MKLNKEAIKAVDILFLNEWPETKGEAIKIIQEIVVEPLEHRIAELERENKELKYKLDHMWTRIPRDFARKT
jgi:hypothetical protein